MAKKSAEAAVTALEPAPAAKKKYSVGGAWSGLPLYVCDVCGLDDVDESRMKKHVYDNHRTKSRPAMVAGKDGTLMRPAVTAPEESGDE